MDLFEVRDSRAFPSTHALIIPAFKHLWLRDADPAKGQAMKEFSFIELACSPKKSNPFFGYDPNVRYMKLKEELFGDMNYELDGDVMDAILKYEELLANSSPSFNMLKTAMDSVTRLKQFLITVDYDSRTKSGGAIYKPKDVTGALKELLELSKSIENLLQKVNEELSTASKTRKDREIGLFER